LSEPRRYVFRPLSGLYFGFLFLLLVVVWPILTVFYRELLVDELGLPPWAFGAVLLLSLAGSYVNVPVTTVEAEVPIYTYREVRFFWVTWRVPQVEMGVRRTVVTLNVGGAIVPMLISAYLMLVGIPSCSADPVTSYIHLLVVMAVVAFTTYRSSRIVTGLGIATPMLGPPMTTALVTLIVDFLSPVSCPTQIAYVGGTLGALIGADLMNLGKLPAVGAPMASIGGAGTFDGIYLTGIMSVLLVLLLT
jgi:uncharacterized membrane protein